MPTSARIFPALGSLYALSLSGEKWLAAIAPIGGTAIDLACGAFALGIVRTTNALSESKAIHKLTG